MPATLTDLLQGHSHITGDWNQRKKAAINTTWRHHRNGLIYRIDGFASDASTNFYHTVVRYHQIGKPDDELVRLLSQWDFEVEPGIRRFVLCLDPEEFFATPAIASNPNATE